jgi:hypothetical protein
MTFVRFFLWLVFAFLMTHPQKTNAQETLEQATTRYRSSFQAVLQNYKNLVYPQLNLSEREIATSVIYRYRPTQDVIAQAYIDDDDQRVVEISFGFLVITESVTHGYAVSGEAEKPQCFINYLNNLGAALLKNAKARQAGNPVGLVPFFGAYARDGRQGCEDITSSDLSNKEAFDYIPGGMNAALAFIIGHELAHHVLGHVDNDHTSLLASRKAETEADAWAIKQSLRIGVTPTVATPMLLMFASFSGSDLNAELESTHPLGIRRLLHSIDKSIAHMKAEDVRRSSRANAENIKQMENWRRVIAQHVP